MFLKVKLFESDEDEIMLNLRRIDWFQQTKCDVRPAPFQYAGTVQVFTGGALVRLDKESSSKFLRAFKSNCIMQFVPLEDAFFIEVVDEDLGEEED